MRVAKVQNRPQEVTRAQMGQEGDHEGQAGGFLADALSLPPQKPGPELFDPSSCSGEWLSEPDWTLEGIRGPQAPGLRSRHAHPHGPLRASSFLQHVGGQH